MSRDDGAAGRGVRFRARENLMVGETISHYRILAEVGAGGMGVVYKAETSGLGASWRSSSSRHSSCATPTRRHRPPSPRPSRCRR